MKVYKKGVLSQVQVEKEVWGLLLGRIHIKSAGLGRIHIKSAGLPVQTVNVGKTRQSL